MTVARIWRGATRAGDRDRYLEYLEGTGIADYLATPGNRGVEILTRIEGERALFTIRTLWTSLDAIRAFAGDDVEVARFYPEDDAFLVDRDLRAEHHELGEIRHPAHVVKSVDHVSVPVRDAAASARFYAAALAPLGIVRLASLDDGATGFGRNGDDDFYIEPSGAPIAGGHVAFAAPSREAVHAFHAAAVAAGGTDNGTPGPRPEYHEHYYAAFVLDHDGHNVEAVYHLDVR
jgi:catechol 2,3-dioxygenase-like lactoylglutathione lyase family enzyme/heme-degrading monooxygenase HmoA